MQVRSMIYMYALNLCVHIENQFGYFCSVIDVFKLQIQSNCIQPDHTLRTSQKLILNWIAPSLGVQELSTDHVS